MAELVVMAVSGASVLVGWKLGKRKPASPEEPHCTGYHAHVIDPKGKKTNAYYSRLDCLSLRDPCCSDGRCSFHCREMCKCSATNEPENIGRRKI